MSLNKFAIIGGDMRYKYLYDLLRNDKYIVKAYDNPKIIHCETNIEDTLHDTDIIIAPIPFNKDYEYINLENTVLSNRDFIELLKKYNNKYIFAGVVDPKLKNIYLSEQITIYDYFDYEDVAINNAIPTAEGAIMTAIKESDKVLFNSCVLVLGYGRCGKVLASTLNNMRAKVSVTYRKSSDKAYINANGMEAIQINELISYINCFDFIFNTIPNLVLNKNMLKKISKNTIIIDIAQAPGGVDYNYAKKVDIKALYCPGIPGRTAPYTAANILKNKIIDIVKEI